MQRLEIKILPYILFLVIPILGRMTDSSNDVRLVATNIFATLVKLIPLEVSHSSASASHRGTDGCDRRGFQILRGCLLIYSHRGRRRGNSFSSCSTIGKWNPIPCRSPSRPICDPISEMELAGWLSWLNTSFTVSYVTVRDRRSSLVVAPVDIIFQIWAWERVFKRSVS